MGRRSHFRGCWARLQTFPMGSGSLRAGRRVSSICAPTVPTAPQRHTAPCVAQALAFPSLRAKCTSPAQRSGKAGNARDALITRRALPFPIAPSPSHPAFDLTALPVRTHAPLPSFRAAAATKPKHAPASLSPCTFDFLNTHSSCVLARATFFVICPLLSCVC